MKSEKEIVEKVAKGFRLLQREEKYDPSIYHGPSEAAEAVFNEVLHLDPANYLALLGLGRCYYYRPRQYADAISTFKKAIDIKPYEPEPYYWIGLTFFHAGERKLSPLGVTPYTESLAYFQKAIELGYKPLAWLYNHIGTVYSRMGKYEEAIDWLKRSAKELEQEEGWIPSTFFLAAEACEHLGRFADAIEWYELYKEHGRLADTEEIDQKIKDLRILD